MECAAAKDQVYKQPPRIFASPSGECYPTAMKAQIAELLQQTSTARREARLPDALALASQAAELARDHGTPTELADALTSLGQLQRDAGNTSQALLQYQEAANLYRAQSATLRVAHTVRHLGDIHQEAGETALAAPHYREALELYRNHEATTPLDLANTLRGYAIHLHKAGEIERVKPMWQEARDIYASLAITAGVEECDRRLASIYS
jgi:tetratricopeptide (TPR) repeat protein